MIKSRLALKGVMWQLKSYFYIRYGILVLSKNTIIYDFLFQLEKAYCMNQVRGGKEKYKPDFLISQSFGPAFACQSR